MSEFLARLDTRTLAESVAGRLREEILWGKRRPGEKLSQEELAREYGVSRIPIREALQQLASEGLVDLRARRGAYVQGISIGKAEELLAIAGALEAIATARGAAKLKPEHLNEMARLLDTMRTVEDRPREWYRLNLEFHMVIIRASGWDHLVNLIIDCRRRLMRYVVQPELHAPVVEEWHQQHQEIYEACRAGDVERVKALFDNHWDFSSDLIKGVVKPEDDEPLKG